MLTGYNVKNKKKANVFYSIRCLTKRTTKTQIRLHECAQTELGLHSLRKHTYLSILKISPPKTENFQMKISDMFHISALNIDCGYSLEPPRRGGSNEYSQYMFLSSNKKNNVYPCKPVLLYKSGA